jgi:nickel transport protein
MKTMAIMVFLLGLSLPAGESRGHSLNYHVEQKGIAVRAFYTDRDPASYSEYEIYGPGDREDIPHQTGRTDKNGFLAFVPDRAGTWKVRLWGESSHGYHGFTAEVKVDKEFSLESFSKPLLATHTKLITGLSLIFGLFGIYAYLKSRRGQGGKGLSPRVKGDH